ncbi:MAG: hypothetical protein KDA27_17290 [Candidatus Eisenbacteria bacterium]|uniref:Uncharacterized protein n=1 Tax=Eiseniibacteriota bacterium TaxID=2212470 RepID=A0A956NGR5_UNCEI|nr:hypothetical protein [Candidatus Eisenbacteria bacterium]MCB9466460.1 hypothetical protein [Candidatus Eisenbacteria bacterium]
MANHREPFPNSRRPLLVKVDHGVPFASPHAIDVLTASEWRRDVPFVRQHSAATSDFFDSIVTVRIPSKMRALVDAAWFRPVLERLIYLASLPRGWDGSTAPPIARSKLEAVLDLMAAVARHDTPIPAIVPAADGGVQVDWHVDDVDIESLFRWKDKERSSRRTYARRSRAYLMPS